MPVHDLLTHTDYVSAVLDNILAAGDQASRAITVGAFFGAENPDSIPQDWREKTTALPDIEALLDSF